MTPTKESELRKKTAHEPMAATSRPPSAGPTARAMLKATLLRETATGSSARGTSSGTMACHAGAFKAAPSPSMKVSASRTQGVVQPASVSVPSATAATSIQVCVKMSRRLRSTMSASAPPGSASRKVGEFSAVCISATMMGVGASVVISHSAPTLCIHVPTFDDTAASHSARKSDRRKGLHGDGARLLMVFKRELIFPEFCCPYDVKSGTNLKSPPASARRAPGTILLTKKSARRIVTLPCVKDSSLRYRLLVRPGLLTDLRKRRERLTCPHVKRLLKSLRARRGAAPAPA